MDPKCSAQDVLRCDFCKSSSVESHCDTCQSRLCNRCVTKGRCSDSYKPHQVVPLRKRISVPRYPPCSQHIYMQCQFYCQRCNSAVCSICISTGAHRGHDHGLGFSDFLQNGMSMKKETGVSGIMDSDNEKEEKLRSLINLALLKRTRFEIVEVKDGKLIFTGKEIINKRYRESPNNH